MKNGMNSLLAWPGHRFFFFFFGVSLEAEDGQNAKVALTTFFSSGLHLNAGLVLTCLTGLQISADQQQRAWRETSCVTQ